jgi:hypothetical protein
VRSPRSPKGVRTHVRTVAPLVVRGSQLLLLLVISSS